MSLLEVTPRALAVAAATARIKVRNGNGRARRSVAVVDETLRLIHRRRDCAYRFAAVRGTKAILCFRPVDIGWLSFGQRGPPPTEAGRPADVVLVPVGPQGRPVRSREAPTRACATRAGPPDGSVDVQHDLSCGPPVQVLGDDARGVPPRDLQSDASVQVTGLDQGAQTRQVGRRAGVCDELVETVQGVDAGSLRAVERGRDGSSPVRRGPEWRG